ncbi:MAG: formylglycine-generating enzyme family protein [Planctomycetaceae bacterium]|nr:formylglycine-generating enzyme family protein [Planctomycetaceae bacterium]
MLSDDVSMEFRLLPAGEFRMGSRGYDSDEEPIHRVVITQPFYMGIYPVTQQQFAVWTQSAGIDHKNHFEGHPHHPAEDMNWFQSRDFCQWLNERCGTAIPPEYVAGLPTEAQWEYACRLMKRDGKPVAVDTEYYTGDGEAGLAQAGWFDEKWDEGSTHPVGSTEKRPTDFGLHELHGNVWEWCRDAWSEDAYKLRVDGIADPMVSAVDVDKSENDAVRVFRGGSWFNSAGNCRAACRSWGGPGIRGRIRGFRVCLFFGPAVPSQTGSAAESEPATGDGARRYAAAESEEAGGDVAELDLSSEIFPERSDGTKF